MPTKYVSFVIPFLLSVLLNRSQEDELAFVYQKIGFQCLLETRFEDAGFCLFQGDIDPRVLISYFPELRGALLDADPTLDVFSGIAECMPPYDSIDDISTSPLPSFFLPPAFRFSPVSPFCTRTTPNDAPSPPLAANIQSWPT
jgi:hypothetical protein